MKLTHRLTRHMNTYMSQQVLLIRMERKQPEDTSISEEDDNASENFWPHEDDESILEEQDIENHERNLVGKRLDTGNHARDSLLGRTPQDGLFASESSSFLREIRFSKHEFPAGKAVSDIKYHHPGSLNNNLFHPFNNQLDYALAIYFAETKTTKGNINKFLSKPLMALLTEKLFYQNADKWIKKLSDIPWGIPNNK